MKLSKKILELTNDPNIIGEILRAKFFNQSNNELGCYTTFTVNPDVIYLGEMPNDNDEMYKCFALDNIIMRYYWDGDGTLIFECPEFTIINDDCKKTNNWE